MDHKTLVYAAVRWLKRTQRCPIVVAELVSYASEQPDAIGYRGGLSILVECKASRADFLRDQKKQHRGRGSMGDYRYYLSPPDVVRPGDLSEGWGLLHFDGKTVTDVTPKHGPGEMVRHYNANVNYAGERLLLLSVLRRQIAGKPVTV